MRYGCGIAFCLLLGINSGEARAQNTEQRPAGEIVIAAAVARELSSRNFVSGFQFAFRSDSSPDPRMKINSEGDNCRASIVVSVEPADAARNWDGSIKESAPSATGLFLDFAGLDHDAIRVYARAGRPRMVLSFKNGPQDDQHPLKALLRYPISDRWIFSPSGMFGEFPSGAAPFRGLLVGHLAIEVSLSDEEKGPFIEVVKELISRCSK